MKLYRLTSNFLIRDIYEMAPGPVDYEHYEHLEARQYEVSIIHKEEQKYIYKSLVLLLGLCLICMVKTKVEYWLSKKKFIIILESNIKTQISSLDREIEKFIAAVKEVEENKFLHNKFLYKSLCDRVGGYKKINESINPQFHIKKIVLNDSKNLLVESIDAVIYKINSYTWSANNINYLYELIENYQISMFFFNIFFLLIVLYRFIKVLFTITLSTAREVKVSFYNNMYKILLIIDIKGMLLKQDKMNKNIFVNNFFKLNFGLQYYFFYNILRFLLSLKNENIFGVFLHNKLFKKYIIPASMFSGIKKTDTGGVENSYTKYDFELQNKLEKYRGKKFSSPISRPYFEQVPADTGCNPFATTHDDSPYSFRYPCLPTRYLESSRFPNALHDWSFNFPYFNPCHNPENFPNPKMEPWLIELSRQALVLDWNPKAYLHPGMVNFPRPSEEIYTPGYHEDQLYHGDFPLWSVTPESMGRQLVSSPSLVRWYSAGYGNFNLSSYFFYPYLSDVVEMLVTFPEFFLFPISIMAWVFLKFTSIDDSGLKISKIGYASFFFSRKVKIGNSRSLLSSVKNQIKSNLFIWLILFTIFFTFCWLGTAMLYDTYARGFFSNSIIANNYTFSIKFFLLFLFLGIFLIHDTVFSTKIIVETYNLLLLFSIFPVLLLLISINNFFFFYVGLEFISLLTYVLLFLNKTTNAFEAGIKYFTSGGLISGAFILFGISNLWNIFGSVDIVDIVIILGCQKEMTSLMVFSFIFIIVGFLFKLAAFPMQQWAPSVYSGVPYSQLGFIMVLFKFTLLAVFLRFYITLQPAFFFFISPVTYGVSIGSMCVGLIGIAYSTHNLSIKKFIAYSSITHIGYIFAIIVDTTNEAALWLGLYYSALYSISILLFFIVLSRFLTINKLEDNFSFKEIETFVDLQKFYNSLKYAGSASGFYKIEFFLLLVSVWSMAGLPPLPGFFGKISILFSLFRSIQWWVYTKWSVVGGMPRHLLDQIFLKEYFIDVAIYFFLFLIFCITITSILMVWYYFKFFKYLFLEIPEKNENDFYEIAVSHICWIEQTRVTAKTWCQTKVPIIIWNWFLIFYTIWLLIIIFLLSWNALTINLDGMMANWIRHDIYPLKSTVEISIFDVLNNDGRLDQIDLGASVVQNIEYSKSHDGDINRWDSERRNNILRKKVAKQLAKESEMFRLREKERLRTKERDEAVYRQALERAMKRGRRK